MWFVKKWGTAEEDISNAKNRFNIIIIIKIFFIFEINDKNNKFIKCILKKYNGIDVIYINN